MRYISLFLFFTYCLLLQSRVDYKAFHPGKLWLDTDGRMVNAHGGGVVFYNGTYYWFGEDKAEFSNNAQVGVNCYSSRDLYNWKFESVALKVSENPNSPIAKGCIIERPKVIYNKKFGIFVMYFHLELKGQGYNAAQVGIAESKVPQGPYTLVRNTRVNAGVWPYNLSLAQRKKQPEDNELLAKSWTPQWLKAVEKGLFVRHHFESGQMCRDMTLFVDDDGKAYHIYSSEDNATIQIAELTDDYLGYTGKYIRVNPAKHNEAPTIFKKDGTYWMITSGCTGWKPNAARMCSAPSIWGPWNSYPNPCVGKNADLTFRAQGTFVLPVQGRKDLFIFMSDQWRPDNPIDGRYVWLPIQFKNGIPFIEWKDSWKL